MFTKRTLFVKRPAGEFPDRETGEPRTQWQDVGILVIKENGQASIKIDKGITVGDEWLQAFPRRVSQDATSSPEA